MPKRALFLDRDGVVNRDEGYVYRSEDFVFQEGIFEFIDLFKRQDYLLFLVTNQSGIGRGYYTLRDFVALSAFMQAELKGRLGYALDQIYFCPHSPGDSCLCRKPSPGMIQRACTEFKVDPAHSWMVGDKMSDMEAAWHAGVARTLLLGDALEGKQPTFSLDSLSSAVKLFTQETKLL